MAVNFIELFAGIGGFRYGLEKANNGDKRRLVELQEPPKAKGYQGRGDVFITECSPAFRCVWANDNDRYASAIYRYHYGEICQADIRAVDAGAIPEHDLLCAGFPCQSFSIAGKRGGFEDTRGTLFFEICRVLRAKRTSYLFLENVKGLLSHDDGYTFQTIIGTLDELGYDCQWQVLNSKNYGVPQNRERVFIIGNLREQPRPKVFPIGENIEGIDEGEYETTGIRTLQGGGHSGGHHSGMTLIHNIYGGFGETEPRVFENYSPSIRTPKGGGHLPMVVHENKSGTRTPHNEAQVLRSGASHNYQTLEIANAVDADGYLRSGERPRDENGKPQLLPIGYRRIRRLTPIECERLQSFPDGWTKYGIDKEGKQIIISDTQRYKCCGNAVTTSVITEIGKQFIKGFCE